MQGFFDPEKVATEPKSARDYLGQNIDRILGEHKGAELPREERETIRELVRGYRNDRKVETLIELVRLLNVAEEKVAQQGVAPVEDILIGTEFTFTTELLHGLKLGETYDEQDEEEKKEKQRQTDLQGDAAELIYTFAEAVKKAELPEGLHLTVSSAKAKNGQMVARRFEYHDQDEALVWYWVLDMDDGCLETQTRPTSYRGLAKKNVGTIIDQHIFGVAGSLGLAPHADIGGGHLSLDVRTMVGSSGLLLVSLLENLETQAGLWQKFFQDPDSVNAPWMSELLLGEETGVGPYLETLRELGDRVEKGNLDIGGAVGRLRALSESMENPEVTKISKQGKEGKKYAQNVNSAPEHYRAVNTEHLDSGGGGARLELRRIKAQEGYGQLMEQIEFVLKLIDDSRKYVGVYK